MGQNNDPDLDIQIDTLKDGSASFRQKTNDWVSVIRALVRAVKKGDRTTPRLFAMCDSGNIATFTIDAIQTDDGTVDDSDSDGGDD